MQIRRKRIETLAQDILRKNPPTNFSVDIEKIAKNFGIVVNKETNPGNDFSGFLYRGGKTPIIGVNSEQASSRQRFTIAHELGHFLLHNKSMTVDHDTGMVFRNTLSEMGTDRDEVEANHFAASLLMPQLLIDKYLLKNRHKILEQKMNEEIFLTKMAEDFGVSQQALVIRLTRLTSN